MSILDFSEIEGFQWDSGNSQKNWHTHGVADGEAEEPFFNAPIIVRTDLEHSTKQEKRFYLLGQTNAQRKLFIVFTIRNGSIRIISARDMTKRELRTYENSKKNT